MSPLCPKCKKPVAYVSYAHQTPEQWKALGERPGDFFCPSCAVHFWAGDVLERECEHRDFECFAVVNRLTDSGRFAAEFRIRCRECGMPFRFLGLPPGLDLNGASVSADGTEGRFAIGTHQTVANIIEGSPTGFTIRREDLP